MTIRLRFVQGNDWISRLIAAEQKTAMPFTPSHVEVLTKDGTGYLGAHFNGGVQIRPIGYDKDTTIASLLLELSDMSSIEEELFWQEANRAIGTPYDAKAILGFLLPGHEHDFNHVICSAYMAQCLRKAHYFLYPLAVPEHLISPRDLLLMLSCRLQVPMI